jgi:hypothetical protein
LQTEEKHIKNSVYIKERNYTKQCSAAAAKTGKKWAAKG